MKKAKQTGYQPEATLLRRTAKLDRINHTYLLGSKVVGAAEWYRTIKHWICLADQNSQSILQQDDERALLYVINESLLNQPNFTENEQAA